MLKDKNFIGLIRYAVAGLAFVYSIGKLFGMKPEQLIPNFRFDTPPSLKVPVETTKAILGAPDKYGKERDLKTKAKDVGKNFIGLIPAGSQIKKTVQGLQAYNKGKDTTTSGRVRFKIPKTLPNLLKTSLFGKSSLPQAQEYYSGGENKNKKTGNRFMQ